MTTACAENDDALRFDNAELEPEYQKPLDVPRYSYLDCLAGRTPVPAAGEPGKFFFSFLMVGGMVTFMATFNGIHHYDWNPIAFFSSSLWLYPLLVVFAMLVRIFWGDNVVPYLIEKGVDGQFEGAIRGAVITFLNVTVMCPVMSAIATMLLNGPSDFVTHWLESFALSYSVALFANFLIVGPLVKLIHNNVVSTSQGMHFLGWLHKNVMPALLFFTS